MSTGRSDTSSKRKKSTPQKFKSRKLFAASRNDILEQPEFSRARDGEDQENQLELSKLPTTLQNKENLPEKCPNGSVTAHRGRGRPKGSKNKTFPSSSTRVYDVREAKSSIDTLKLEGDGDNGPQNGAATPHRGRGRPKGSTKVKPEVEIGLKRSRGRPKGSKNKKPSKAALLKLLASGQKIGRGRPRKIPPVDEPLTPKRGRGRPKGNLNKVQSAERLMLLSGANDVKKKRGRPRKILLHATLKPLTPKGPRGRPRIKPLLPEPVDELALLSGTNDVKKKRGRPRKLVLHTTLIPLTAKRPRGRPRIKALFPEPVNEVGGSHLSCSHPGRLFETSLPVKSSESNTEEEDNTDDSEEYEEKDDDERERTGSP